MKSRIFPSLFTAAALAAGTSLSAQEQVVSYDFNSSGSPSSWSKTLLTGQPKAPAFAAGFTGGQGGLSSTRGNFYARLQSTGDAQTSASRFTFELKPSQPLHLGQITFDIGYQNSGKGPHPSYTLNYQLGVKIGEAREVLLPKVVTLPVPASTDPAYPGGSLDVKTPALFDLGDFKDAAASITFTIYLYVTNASGSLTADQTGRIDNIVVTTAANP